MSLGTAAALAAVALLAGPPSAGALPAPAVGVVPAPEGGASRVFGANAAGDTFYDRGVTYTGGGLAGGEGRVRHADGSTTDLARPLDGRGAVGPDGRLWLPLDGSLWSVAPDGTFAEHPITAPEATATTGIVQVEVGPDGRIWFLDRNRSSVGSIATDGSDPQVWPLAGAGALARFAPGPDGRMWVVHDQGALQAVTTDGTVTDYPSLGAGVRALRATSGALYAVVRGALVRIDPDGARTTVWRDADVGLVDVGSSGGWAWFAATDSLTSAQLLAVSPSGRIAPFGMLQSWLLPGSGPVFSLAPDAQGGFVGAVGGQLARIPNPAVEEVLAASGRVVLRNGTYWLQVDATARTPGGRGLSGTFDVVLWGGMLYGDTPGFLLEKRQTLGGRVTITNGRGGVDIPITAALVRSARPQVLLHASCCDVSIRRPGPAGSPGLSSWQEGVTGGPLGSYYGPVVPSHEAAWLDDMTNRALGKPIVTASVVAAAARMAAGTSDRVAETRRIVWSVQWRRHRVVDAYQRWFGRNPTSSEREYWAGRLDGGTTSAMDVALGAKDVARDAAGTTNSARGTHLAEALHLPASYAAGYRSKLDAGVPWSTVVYDAYWSSAAKQRRIDDMGPRSAFTPSLSALGSELGRTRDERGPLVSVLSTMPLPLLGY